LLESIDYLHSNSICHRDVNPNNIIISTDSDNKIKSTLIDFNVSKRFNSTKFFNPILMMTNTGTPMYQAPEMVEGAVSYYDEKIDLWSVGAILYFMITGKHAFQ
jgi:serine/threonine protein kinase